MLKVSLSGTTLKGRTFPAAGGKRRKVGKHLPAVHAQWTCNCYFESWSRMVNPGMVNAAARNFSPPYFCVFFRDSGRFLDSENPVNYLFVTAVSLSFCIALSLAKPAASLARP
jgi:hypothetical protein